MSKYIQRINSLDAQQFENFMAAVVTGIGIVAIITIVSVARSYGITLTL